MSEFPALPPLREVIAAHDLRADKKLGQNFLFDSNITDKIVRHAGDVSQAHVIEIGPGPGGLTRSLLKAGARSVHAVEFDPRAVAALQDLQRVCDGRLVGVENDALTVDLTALCDAPRMIVANLPYNIATVLLIGWLRQIRQEREAFGSMTLMFQKEVAERICAQPGSKAYGRLSVMAQWLCDVKKVFDVPGSAFTPAPKVTSSIVRLVPKALDEGAPDFEAVEALTAAAFGQRRKMIRSSLRDYSDYIKRCGLDDTLRAENLSVADYIKLAKCLT